MKRPDRPVVHPPLVGPEVSRGTPWLVIVALVGLVVVACLEGLT